MGNSFVKLKTKYLLIAILKSVVFGISCGLFTVGAVMLPLKLCSIIIHFGFYILIGAGAAVLFGAPFFCILFAIGLTDKKLAEKLDNEYALNERVQTSIAYENQQGDIITLLKEDTKNRLDNLPKRKFDFFEVLKKIWCFVLIAVISLSLFIAALCVNVDKEVIPEPPDNKEPDYNGDNPFDYELSLQSKLYDLMRNVRNSNLHEKERDAFVEVLENLDSVLQSLEWESEVRLAVITAVYAIDGITNNANSFRTIGELIGEFDENLSKAIIEGVILYKAYSNYNFAEFDSVKGVYSRVNSNIEDRVDDYFVSSLNEHKFTDPDDGAVVLGLVADLRNALTESGVAETDALYSAIDDFATSLQSVCDTKVGKGYTLTSMNEGTEISLKLSYGDFETSAINAMLLQSYNCIMDLYVRESLSNIFNVPINGIGGIYDDLNVGGGSDDGDKDPDDGNHGGGFGEGDEIYGSKDLIYDPDSGKQVEYGTVYDDYYKYVDARLQSGELPQELADFIDEYFKILLNGIKDDSGEN